MGIVGVGWGVGVRVGVGGTAVGVDVGGIAVGVAVGGTAVAVANGVSTQDGTASFIPAGAFIMAFRFQVWTQPGGTASYSAGTSTGTTAYLPAGTSTVGGTTSFGGLGTSVANSFGLWQSASARTMRFTFNASTTNGSGTITYGFWYFLPTVA
mgnify:CR=1 FL=1